jgi:hypothetical protein
MQWNSQVILTDISERDGRFPLDRIAERGA